jgi:hypothetical protein
MPSLSVSDARSSIANGGALLKQRTRLLIMMCTCIPVKCVPTPTLCSHISVYCTCAAVSGLHQVFIRRASTKEAAHMMSV